MDITGAMAAMTVVESCVEANDICVCAHCHIGFPSVLQRHCKFCRDEKDSNFYGKICVNCDEKMPLLALKDWENPLTLIECNHCGINWVHMGANTHWCVCCSQGRICHDCYVFSVAEKWYCKCCEGGFVDRNTLVPCHFCEALFCNMCKTEELNPCHVCKQTFCSCCSVIDYSMREGEVMCIDCNS